MDIERFGKGAEHIADERDYAFGAEKVEPYDWSKPYSFDVPLVPTDQNGSSSCVGQSAMNMARISYFKKYGTLHDFSARFIYSQIFLPNGGAYLRDGVSTLVKLGIPKESTFPSQPETENHMKDKSGVEDVYDDAKAFDIYTGDFAYAAVSGGIDGCATAIRDHGSVMIGARGTNVAWNTPDVGPGDDWGHAICGVAPVIRNGKKCIKFLNSWGADWGENGYGYISEEYFASGSIMSVYVLTDNFVKPKFMEYLEKNDNKLVQNGSTGAIGLIKNKKILVTSAERAGLLALTHIIRNGGGGAVPPELWDQFPKEEF